MRTATGLRIMTGLALASAATLIVLVARLPDGGSPPAGEVGDVVRVGVVEGQSVPGYLAGSRNELAALRRSPAAPPTWALVSLTGYLAPDRLLPLLAGGAPAQVYARARLPGRSTQVARIPAHRLPGDVVAGMLATAARRDREEAEYRRLLRDLTGDAPNTVRLRTAYRDAAAMAAAEARAYRAHCACVFAAVVRGSPAVLQSIADRSGVRAVDPAPEVAGLDRAEFRPPLPEQRTTVPQGTRSATGTAPGAARPVAPVTPPPLPSSSGAPVPTPSSDDPAAGSGPSDPASEERSAVPSAPVPTPDPGLPSPGPGASRGRSGR